MDLSRPKRYADVAQQEDGNNKFYTSNFKYDIDIYMKI